MARIHVPMCFTSCVEDSVEFLDAMNVPKWINEGKRLLSSLESVKARLEAVDVLQETKKGKARRCRLIREMARLYSCIHDCTQIMEAQALGGSGRLWNLERGTTRYLQLLRRDANRITAKCESSLIQNPICEEKSTQSTESTAPTNLVAANPSEDLTASSMEDQVVAALLKEKELPVVCIWGKSGTGKTTLAKKVFHNSHVRQHFEAFAWVSAKQYFNYMPYKDQINKNILSQLLPYWKKDFRKITVHTQMILDVLKEKRCLVVVEDIRTVEHLEMIQILFPRDHSISKYLITTPLEDVAKAVTSRHGAYKMPPLDENECFEMLKEKANFDYQELHSVGKAVFRMCADSPFLALVLGISLKTMDVASRDQLLLQLDSLQIGGEETEVLGLIYDRLPHELKSGLLYMGQFPQGQDIQIEKLYLLLDAEDLVMSPDTGTSVKRIFDELTHRMLVEVTSMYKSCRLHDQIRDFCISQGLLEKYFDIADFKGGKSLRISGNRLAIYLSNYRDDRIGHINKKRICSLLIFDTNESGQTSLPPEIVDLKDFIFIRVLYFDGVDFIVRKLPKGIDKLLLLRYLSFQGCFLKTLPSFFRKFQFLETLDLRVICKMIIANVLYKMKSLRHLFFPLSYESADNEKLQLHGLEMLEILVNFDIGVCKVNDLSVLSNIRILMVVSEENNNELDAVIQCSEERAASIEMQLSVSIRNFECYSTEKLARFKRLLECKSLHSVNIEGPIDQLPKNVTISPNITEMVCDGSELEDDHLLNVLGNLKKLQSLVLLSDAFVGKEMAFSAGSKFLNLKILKLQNLRFLEKITFEHGVMPMLSTLVIEMCEKLKMVLMPKALDRRLKLAIREEGDDVYSVEPLPFIID